MSRKTEITLLFRLLPLRHLATVGLRVYGALQVTPQIKAKQRNSLVDVEYV